MWFVKKNGLLLLIVILFPFLFYFHTRGMIAHDGGYILNSAMRILRGEHIYRDFDFVYTPLSVFLTSGIFVLFGQSILTERLLSLLLSILAIITISKLCERLKCRFREQLLVILIYLSWGPTHINFISPVILSLVFGLATVLYLTEFIHSPKPAFLIWAGALAGMTLLTKQNFGTVLLLVFAVCLATHKSMRSLKSVLSFFTGYVLPIFFISAYLIYTGSFWGFLHNMYFYMFQKIAGSGALTTSLFYIHGPKDIPKTLLYCLPFLLSVVAFTILWSKKRMKDAYLVAFPFIYYLVSIRPETDFVHLAPALALTGIPLCILTGNKSTSFLRMTGIIISAVLIILGVYSALFMGYYRWETPIIRDSVFMNNPRILIWTHPQQEEFLHNLNKVVNANSKHNDYIFINDNAPLLYFVTNRMNATKYDFIVPYFNSDKEQSPIVAQLQKHRAKVVLLVRSSEHDNTLINRYILSNYHKVKQLGKYDIYLL